MVIVASFRWVPALMSVALVGWAYWRAGAYRHRSAGARPGLPGRSNGHRTHQLLREADLPQLGGTIIAGWSRDGGESRASEPAWRLRIDLPAPDARSNRVVREWKAPEALDLEQDLHRAVEYMRSQEAEAVPGRSFGKCLDVVRESGTPTLVFGLNGLGFRLQRNYLLSEAELLLGAWSRLDAMGGQMVAKLADLDAT